jgi:hypothetical protein
VRPPWPLPLACALVPVVAVHAAWYLSRHAGLIPDCIPHFEGCTSISRAARHGTGNLLFKALMLPCAVLQAAHWWLAARWVEDHRGGLRAARALRVLALVAGTALAAYVWSLGSEGSLYGWMRRYGITFYFGGSFLAMLVFLGRYRASAARPSLARAMTAVCATLLALGLASVLAQLLAVDEQALDRLRNAMEWQLGALFTLWFLLHALAWRRAGVGT